MMRKYSFIIIIGIICLAYPTFSALYGPEKQSELFSRLDLIIAWQNSLSQSKLPDYNSVEKSMIDSQKDKYSLLARLVDNLFVCKSYHEIEVFMINDFRKRDLGRPYLSYISFAEPLVQNVVSVIPSDDSQVDIKNKNCVLKKYFMIIEGIRYFDQQFESFIYKLKNQKGLMVIRGNYVFVDFNLNGVPDETYLIKKYQDKDKKYWNCLQTVALGESKLEATAFQARYIDSLCVVLEYIMDYYPIKAPEDKKEIIQAKLIQSN